MPTRSRAPRLSVSSILASTDFDERLPHRLRWFADGRRLSFVDRYPDSLRHDAGRPFETMYYPDRRHGIENRHAHLYEAMTDLLKRWL